MDEKVGPVKTSFEGERADARPRAGHGLLELFERKVDVASVLSGDVDRAVVALGLDDLDWHDEAALDALPKVRFDELVEAAKDTARQKARDLNGTRTWKVNPACSASYSRMDFQIRAGRGATMSNFAAHLDACSSCGKFVRDLYTSVPGVKLDDTCPRSILDIVKAAAYSKSCHDLDFKTLRKQPARPKRKPPRESDDSGDFEAPRVNEYARTTYTNKRGAPKRRN